MKKTLTLAGMLLTLAAPLAASAQAMHGPVFIVPPPPPPPPPPPTVVLPPPPPTVVLPAPPPSATPLVKR